MRVEPRRNNCSLLLARCRRLRSPRNFIPETAYAQILRRFGGQIAHELESQRLKGGRIGVDVEVPSFVRALNSAGVKLAANGDKALTKARTKKTQDEVECHRIAAAITESGFEMVKRAIRPGVSEIELRAIFMNEVYRLGADFGLRTHRRHNEWTAVISEQSDYNG